MIIYIKSKAEFEEQLKNSKILVDFYADWCGPCKQLMPILEQYSIQHPEINIVKVNVEKYEDLAIEYGVLSLPMLIIYEYGSKVRQKVGFLSGPMVDRFVKGN